MVARVTVEDGETSYDTRKAFLEGAVDGLAQAERRRRLASAAEAGDCAGEPQTCPSIGTL